MKIERIAEIETTDIQIGDRIHVDHYTATCQEITQKGALFLMDQYLDEPIPMNKKNTNKGRYEESDLRRALQSEDILKIFSFIREWLGPFDNGDLFRLPWAGEIFDTDYLKDRDWVEPDGMTQWPAMRDVHRRTAADPLDGLTDSYWIANKYKESSTGFCSVNYRGHASFWLASLSLGVRPAFLIG